MNFNSYIKLTGQLDIKKYDKNNNVILETRVPNLVVSVGKEHVAERLISDTQYNMNHMAIGSGLTAPAVTDSYLIFELARESLVSVIRSGANITYTATFPAGVGTGSITEAGIFNEPSAGIMLCRTTFPVITKSAEETIAISWTVTVG